MREKLYHAHREWSSILLTGIAAEKEEEKNSRTPINADDFILFLQEPRQPKTDDERSEQTAVKTCDCTLDFTEFFI